MSIDHSKKHFCNISIYCFVGWWVKPNKISSCPFWFLSLIIAVFRIDLESTFLQSMLVFTFCCVEKSSLDEFFDSLSWIEFGICFITFRRGGGLITYGCKEAYRLDFCKDDRSDFAD